MAITNTFGFDYFTPIRNTIYTDLTGLGKIPFTAITLNGGHSSFRFESYRDKVWLRSLPSNSSRTPVTRCYCSSWGGYLGGTCMRRTTAHDAGPTNTKRTLDSSLRTPTLSMRFREVYRGMLDGVENRYFTMGFRLWLPDGISGTSEVLVINNVSNGAGGLEVIGSGDFRSQDLDHGTVYVEVCLDKKTGVIRRWIGERELARLTLSDSYKQSFNVLFFQFGRKSTSTAGGVQGTVTSRQYGSCPSPTTFPYDTGAPQDLNYAIADLYFMTETAHGGDGTVPQRLGEIEVLPLPVKDFLIDRFWTPPTEAPVETVSRIKVTNQTNNLRSVTGDLRSDAGTVLVDVPEIADGEEVIYANIQLYGHRKAGGVSRVRVSAENGQRTLSSTMLNLPLNVLTTDLDQTEVVSLEKLHGLDGLEVNDLADLKLKIDFQE